MPQHPAVRGTQLGAGLHAELIIEPLPDGLVVRQRQGLLPCSGQHENQAALQ